MTQKHTQPVGDIKTMPDKNSELRKAILNIDTVYKISKNESTQFLLPEFYVDRLVEFISAHITALLTRIEADEMTLFTRNDVLVHAVLLARIQSERALIEKRMM